MSASDSTIQPAALGWPGRAWRPYALALPALILLIAVIGYPLLTIVLRSLSEPEWGVQNYAWFFGAPVNLTVLRRTFTISAWVTLVCVVSAYPYAYLMTAVGPRVRLMLVLCVLIPFWVSGVVRTLSWVILLQDSGVINSLLRAAGFSGVKLIRTQTGVVIGMAQVLLPFMILPLYSVMKGIDLRLMRAARSLGASPFRAFFTVYLPLSLPGVHAGAIIVFILALGFYITPALLGGPRSTMLSTLVQTQVLSLLQWGRGGAMGVVLLVATFLLLALAAPVMRSRHREAGRR
ncbi:MAG: ABC transporter permease subunit [Mesorhizobium sp.]|uniref:ABC transporter permease n=1 Tax=unclassified Mesorhizobium TaxID=325217 RepID=UPI000F75E351|nr:MULTISPECIES: ABC transporter permease [unclassified Mesorhizobium]AZO51143.1 ABC transporter permease [Mesorhizobium sp. M4B.F.Ca.ET.058.02.1.1]RVC42571.1 ABC transporter permease subunit [Mesorhizobium sp. M4A.F.Ca.ET.090.04.2.1]RWC37571.1 MAG: ABC transporter permease subunit [Mesorhizobium sp.]RWD07722.1 MAG: ABC transporter permease subunit [Mesorhizobium sp.]RWD18144.1 MAG: ABC transporter permease subunit [Mesorhizobium sp.]